VAGNDFRTRASGQEVNVEREDERSREEESRITSSSSLPLLYPPLLPARTHATHINKHGTHAAVHVDTRTRTVHESAVWQAIKNPSYE